MENDPVKKICGIVLAMAAGGTPMLIITNICISYSLSKQWLLGMFAGYIVLFMLGYAWYLDHKCGKRSKDVQKRMRIFHFKVLLNFIIAITAFVAPFVGIWYAAYHMRGGGQMMVFLMSLAYPGIMYELFLKEK